MKDPADIAFSEQAAQHVLLIAAHEPSLDPRLGWIVGGSPLPIMIHQLGVLYPMAGEGYRRRDPKGNIVRAVPRKAWKPRMAISMPPSPAAAAALEEVRRLGRLLDMSDAELGIELGASPGHARIQQFRWYLRYLLDTAATLVNEAQAIHGIAAIIATDTDTLLAALLLKGLLGLPVFYDAHEYWPEADVNALPGETRFWIGFERRLLPHTDYRQTVSPDLAAFFQQEYGLPFASLPNCEPAASALPPPIPAAPKELCRFLFLGGFAPKRGIDTLIEAWSGTPPHAVLLLQGPDNAFKEEMKKLAKSMGLLGKRIFFPDAVRVNELISAAAAADVGLIPYTTLAGNAYRFCCPNKLSQYMAAALPILANETDFVARTIPSVGCGMVVNFQDREALLAAIGTLAGDAGLRRKFGAAARDHFIGKFNWDVLSAPFYSALSAATEGKASVLSLRSPKVVTPALAERVFKHTVRPVVRYAYRQVQEKRGGSFHRILLPLYRAVPVRIRHYLIHKAEC